MALQSGIVGQQAPSAQPNPTQAAPVAQTEAVPDGQDSASDAPSEEPPLASEAKEESSKATRPPEADAPAQDPTPEPAQEATVAEVPESKTATEAEPPEPSPQGATDDAVEQPGLLDKHPVENSKNTYKPGTGLVISSADERFSMGIRLRIQMRNELTNVEEDGDNTLSNRFGARRARLQFKGNIFSKKIKYKAELAFSPNDLGHSDDGSNSHTPLLSWYTEFVHLRDLSLRLGQYKLLYSRQRVVSSGDQEFVDRNLAQGEFNLDRDIGGHLFSKDLFGLGLFKYYAGVTIAEGRDSWEKESTEKGVGSYQPLVRLEVLPFGDFDDYKEVDFSREKKLRVSLGGAYAFTKNGTRTRGYRGSLFADGGTADFHNATADLIAKYAGLTLYSDFFWRKGDRNTDVAAGDEDGNLTASGLGGSVQLGYLLPTLPLGVGVRYAAMDAGGNDDETTLSKEQEVGGTLGWYFAGHNLKLQSDFFHIWSEGVNEDQFRVQLQVAY